jgi:hypothetical protein
VIGALVDELERLPQIEAAGLIGFRPFTWREGTPVSAAGLDPSAVPPRAVQVAVNPSYFRALRIPVVDGRLLSGADATAELPVAVVSAALAERLWPNRSAVGRQLQFGSPSQIPIDEAPPALTVVGVVGDVSRSLVEPRVPEVYVPLGRAPGIFLFLQARTRDAGLELVPAIERTIARVDPNLPLDGPRWLSDVVGTEGDRPRFLAGVLVAFASMTGLVAVIGVYAVNAWIASQRRREAALRLALGASPTAVVRLLAGRGGLVVAAGLIVGWVASLALSTVLEADLHGVGASDLPTRAAVAAVLVGVCTAALWWPARRAARVDPARVLREE